MSTTETFIDVESGIEGESKPIWKKFFPWILSGIFFIVIIILIIVIATSKKSEDNVQVDYSVKQEQLIPFVDPLNQDGKIGGAAVHQGKDDILNSKYYPMIDFYNEKSSSSLKILEHFKTYQQTNDCSCGCGCSIMVGDYFGIKINESHCVKVADVGYTHPDHPNSHGIYGAYPRDVANALNIWNGYRNSRQFY